MRFIILITASLLVHASSYAELDDDTLERAAAHYEAMIYADVAGRIAEDVEAAQLTDKQANEWLDAVVGKLATCHLDAFEYLGERVRDETLQALASGASKQELSQIFAKQFEWESNWQAMLAVYSDARNQCAVLVNQEFGVSY